MKKGFTIVELLATLVIVIILALLVTPRFTKLTNDNRTKGYKEIENRLKEAAQKYLTDNYMGSSTTTTTITKAQLLEEKYISEIYDLKDKSVCTANVVVTNLNTNPTYTVHLTCSNYTS